MRPLKITIPLGSFLASSSPAPTPGILIYFLSLYFCLFQNVTEWTHSEWVWILISIKNLKNSHVLANISVACFMSLLIMFHCIIAQWMIHSPFGDRIGCLQFVPIKNKAAMANHIQVFVFPKGATTELYGKCMFIRACPIALRKG